MSCLQACKVSRPLHKSGFPGSGYFLPADISCPEAIPREACFGRSLSIFYAHRNVIEYGAWLIDGAGYVLAAYGD